MAARLRRLDAGTIAALVADLWAARGYETTRDGARVVAATDGSAVVVRVGRGADERPPDVVVSLGGRDPAPPGGRVVDATDLAEMLLYAVDGPTTGALCTRYLGGPPEALAPSRGVRDRLAGFGAWRLARPVVGRRGARIAVLIVAVAALVGVLSWGGAPPAAPTGETGALSGGVDTPAAVPSATTTPATRAAAVPGLAADGVANLTALAAAHERGLAAGSFTAWVDRYYTRTDGTRVQRDVDVAVTADRSLTVVTVEDDGGQTTVLAVYDDGEARYAAEPAADRYRRLDPGESVEFGVPGPTTLRREVVARYLSTPTTRVSGAVTRDDETAYRVVGTGPPSVPALDGVRNYSVVALVDERGVVRELTARYVPAGDDATPVRFEVTFDRLDATRVEPPFWYLRRFADDATPTTGE